MKSECRPRGSRPAESAAGQSALQCGPYLSTAVAPAHHAGQLAAAHERATGVALHILL